MERATMIYKEVDVQLIGDSIVEVRRSFHAPQDLVWRAHTEPELLRRWTLGYPGWSMPICEMDVRVGGKYLWRWRADEDGKEFGFHGEYREVVAPALLVFTQSYDPGDVGGDMGAGSVHRLALAEAQGVTTLFARMDYQTKEARDAAMATGMTDGMAQNYALLEGLLETHTPNIAT